LRARTPPAPGTLSPMELTPAILSAPCQWLGHALYAAGLLLALGRMPWYWLRRPVVHRVFSAATVGILVMWQVRAELPGGPAVHLLGAALATLAFGWQLAILSLSIALVASTLAAGHGWGALGANGTVLVLVAVGVGYATARASERWLPAHLFVYLFAAAFLGAALSAGAAALAAFAFVLASGVMAEHALVANYLPTSLLLLFPEAFLTGALITMAAVYRPQWLVSFDERRYLGA